jgi:CheY-like chemotaxis protein
MKASPREQSLVLIVDHEQAVLDQITAVLSDNGFACRCCSTAEAALELAPLLHPDLIITDVSLQGMSGVEMCAQLKQDQAFADVPVMFLSAGQIPDIIRRREGDQSSYYLRKPFDPRVLPQLIDQAFPAARLVALGPEQ